MEDNENNDIVIDDDLLKDILINNNIKKHNIKKHNKKNNIVINGDIDIDLDIDIGIWTSCPNQLIVDNKISYYKQNNKIIKNEVKNNNIGINVDENVDNEDLNLLLDYKINNSTKNKNDIPNNDILNNDILNNDILNNDVLNKILTSTKLKYIKSYNVLKKCGIKKEKILKWKEAAKNAILENIMEDIQIIKKEIPDKNTVKNYIETEDFYIIDGIFKLKDNKKWLTYDMNSMAEYNENGCMYYFKDLDNVLINNLSLEQQYLNKMKEREDLEIEEDILKKVIENEVYVNYNDNIVEVNNNLLLEETLEKKIKEEIPAFGKPVKYEIKNETEIIKEIQIHKENIINKKSLRYGKETTEQTRNTTLRKLLNYINNKNCNKKG